MQEVEGKKSNIAMALCKAQMQMTRALKSAKNPHLKNNYADLASVQDACQAPLNDNGIAIFQPIGTEDGKPFVETVFMHGESGETLSCRVWLIVGKNDMQGLGSAITYARRYGLMAMAGIAPDDDDGHAAVKSVKAAPVAEEMTQADELRHIENMRKSETLDELKHHYTILFKAGKATGQVEDLKDRVKSELAQAAAPKSDDTIPYEGP